MNIEQKKFLPGTTLGEASWLVCKALTTLAPMAPAVFGRQNLAGGIDLDFNKWMEAAKTLARKIQIESQTMVDSQEAEWVSNRKQVFFEVTHQVGSEWVLFGKTIDRAEAIAWAEKLKKEFPNVIVQEVK